MKKKIIVAMTGASGAILGVRLLQELRRAQVETHLIMSEWAQRTLTLETAYSPKQVCALADESYASNDLSARLSSGSFRTQGMIVVPCSMKTLAAMANGFSCNLIIRAADVCIKERRRLVLVPRETPVSEIHLNNMAALSRCGAVILPPCIGFYTKPQTIDDVLDHLVGKMLDALDVEHELFPRWDNPHEAK